MGKGNLKIENVNKSFHIDGNKVNILNNINLEINEGEFVVIVGHSGCGKSTLLKIIAGLVSYDNGLVTIGDKKIVKSGLDRGMIFQEHRLFPWLKIKENIALAVDGESDKLKEKLVEEHLALVKLSGFENAYPHQLSGGMSQRAAIARALVNNPEILLLDEPFGALDALTKIKLQQEVLKIWGKEKTTMIMVSHDIDEAIYLADKIVIMGTKPGRIREIIKVDIGRPRDRGSSDFAIIKKKVYSYFFENEINELEYSI